MEKTTSSLGTILAAILGLLCSFAVFVLGITRLSDAYSTILFGRFVYLFITLLLFIPAIVVLKDTEKGKRTAGVIGLVICMVIGIVFSSIICVLNYTAFIGPPEESIELSEYERIVYNYIIVNKGTFTDATSVRCVYISREIGDEDPFFMFQLSGKNTLGATVTETYMHYTGGPNTGKTMKTFIEASYFLESMIDEPKKVNDALTIYWKKKGL